MRENIACNAWDEVEIFQRGANFAMLVAEESMAETKRTSFTRQYSPPQEPLIKTSDLTQLVLVATHMILARLSTSTSCHMTRLQCIQWLWASVDVFKCESLAERHGPLIPGPVPVRFCPDSGHNLSHFKRVWFFPVVSQCSIALQGVRTDLLHQTDCNSIAALAGRNRVCRRSVE